MIKVIDRNLSPTPLSFGKKAIKVNKVCYIEKIDSKLYKTDINLGLVQTLAKTENGDSYYFPKEEVFRLDSLYRCIIDTGILYDSFDNIDFSIENHPKLVAYKGLMVLSPVKYNDNGVIKLGVCIVNISSVHIPITKYMEFAVLVCRVNHLIDLPTSYE